MILSIQSAISSCGEGVVLCLRSTILTVVDGEVEPLSHAERRTTLAAATTPRSKSLATRPDCPVGLIDASAFVDAERHARIGRSVRPTDPGVSTTVPVGGSFIEG